LLLAALVRLNRGDGVHLLARGFEMDLLAETGFRPQWDVCASCGGPLDAAEVWWAPLAGGVLCRGCRARHPEADLMEVTTLKVLRAIQRGPYEEAARIRLTPALAAVLERVMHALVRATAERDLASQRFIEAVRRASITPGGDEAAGESVPDASPVL
jgi:DNA repair protein RecO (recombination protein O)